MDCYNLPLCDWSWWMSNPSASVSMASVFICNFSSSDLWLISSTHLVKLPVGQIHRSPLICYHWSISASCQAIHLSTIDTDPGLHVSLNYIGEYFQQTHIFQMSKCERTTHNAIIHTSQNICLPMHLIHVSQVISCQNIKNVKFVSFWECGSNNF